MDLYENKPLRYTTTEVHLPPGRSVEDLDWTAFAWTIRKTVEHEVLFAEFVVVPGMVLHRWDAVEIGLPDPFVPGSPEEDCNIRQRFSPDEDMFFLAMEKTESLLNRGYIWDIKPFRCEFGESSIRHRFEGQYFGLLRGKVETLGEVVSYGDGEGKQLVLDYIEEKRMTLRKEI